MIDGKKFINNIARFCFKLKAMLIKVGQVDMTTIDLNLVFRHIPFLLPTLNVQNSVRDMFSPNPSNIMAGA